MGIYVFAELLRVLPPGNIGTIGAPFALADRLRHLLLPAATLGVVMVATWSRYTRASMLEVIGEDYIRTARAKGVSRGAIVLKHALKNALIPLDRKSTRLNSSHGYISYAVFCLKKKKK